MSWTDTIDRAYAATRLTQAEERARECHRVNCIAPGDETRQCWRCAEWYCDAHLVNDLCPACDRLVGA